MPLPNLDYSNTAQFLGTGPASGMGGIFAQQAMGDFQDQRKQRELSLQLGDLYRQQESLAANVANAQNTPTGIATLAGGALGEAQSNAVKGNIDLQTMRPKIQADLEKFKAEGSANKVKGFLSTIDDGINILTANGPAGMSMLNPEQREIASKGPADPLTNLTKAKEHLSKLYGVFNPEMQGKLKEKRVDHENEMKKAEFSRDTQFGVADRYASRNASDGDTTSQITKLVQSGKLSYEKAAVVFNTLAAQTQDQQQKQLYLQLAQQYEAANLQAKSASGIGKPVVQGLPTRQPTSVLGDGQPKPIQLTPAERQAIINRLKGQK